VEVASTLLRRFLPPGGTFARPRGGRHLRSSLRWLWRPSLRAACEGSVTAHSGRVCAPSFLEQTRGRGPLTRLAPPRTPVRLQTRTRVIPWSGWTLRRPGYDRRRINPRACFRLRADSCEPEHLSKPLVLDRRDNHIPFNRRRCHGWRLRTPDLIGSAPSDRPEPAPLAEHRTGDLAPASARRAHDASKRNLQSTNEIVCPRNAARCARFGRAGPR
jgi:hypothetical protein